MRLALDAGRAGGTCRGLTKRRWPLGAVDDFEYRHGLGLAFDDDGAQGTGENKRGPK